MNHPSCKFNIFKVIRNNYDKDVLRIARIYERNHLSLTSHKYHLRFNHLLKDNNILPKSLRFRSPINSPQGYAICKKMGFQFLRLRISQCHGKIKSLTDNIDKLLQALADKLSKQDLNSLTEVVKYNVCKLETSLKERHRKKQDRLLHGKSNVSHEDFVDKDRWVVNLSDRELNDQEKLVLQHGLKYSTTPRDVPVGKILASIESGIFSLDEIQKQEIRVNVKNILTNAKPPKRRNLNREEEKALKCLKDDQSIVILPADKGNAVVIMNRLDYNNKIQSMLNDDSTYKKITDKRRNPTSQTEKELNKLLMKISLEPSPYDAEKSQIPPSLYRFLHSSDATSATFYGLPKIHKPDVPLRPITSSIGSPTYNLSKHMVTLLSPLLNNTYTVKNSLGFKEKMSEARIQQDELMVSFDVVSLFTSIPIDLALTVAKQRLDSDTTLSVRSNMSINNIMTLLQFVLEHCFFEFENIPYQQIFGCPMGSPVSALLANMVMEHIEETALSTYPNPPKWWFRYVDDSHSCLKKSDVLHFHQHLNSINGHIQFTFEEESSSGLAFLDTNTKRSDEGQVVINVYRKPTHTERYLDFNSHNPTAHKRSVATTLLRRAKEIPSTDVEREAELKHVRAVLANNNYPASFVKKCEKKINDVPVERDEVNQSYRMVVLPYVGGVSEKISRALKTFNIKVAHKPIKKISNLFPRPKGEKEPALATAVVYKIKCQDCDFIYYGQTDRSLRTRINEHRRAVCHRQVSSKVAQHANSTGHNFDFDNAKAVDKEGDYHRRVFLEAWHSELDASSGNDRIQIPVIYRTLIESCKSRAR